ncbi:hypothetical protein Tco_0938683 [Tanacetum coccineum]|uniref:MULE transposase domain-containing protein n=1 Tax=Tanacetum coccineum TaxID=301880 RepID=A0ABQ5DKM2_9ASTR
MKNVNCYKQSFRAKAKAEREIRGDYILQYFMLRDYVVELQSTNPNTTVKIAVERNIDPYLPTRVFQRIYICLGALKLDFRACRRDLLDLDRAFMKGPFPGQVLVAVGLDSNNGIYLLAYALVESETYKDLLWRAASTTSVKEFEKCMLELKTMNPKAYEWLNKIPPEYWVRSYFSGRAKSDLLLNKICEDFNGKIVGGRDKPVITLLEYIKDYCMKRIMNVQSVIEKCTGPLTLTATRIMESIKKEAHLMKVLLNMALNDRAASPPKTWVNLCYWLTTWRETYSHKVGRERKKRKSNTRHNKATCKGQGRKAIEGGNNVEASGSASRQAQQTEPAVGKDGSGGPGVGVVIGLSSAGQGGAGGACVASQGLSHTRWTKRRVQTERISPQKRTLTQPASQPSTSSQVPEQVRKVADCGRISFPIFVEKAVKKFVVMIDVGVCFVRLMNDVCASRRYLRLSTKILKATCTTLRQARPTSINQHLYPR